MTTVQALDAESGGLSDQRFAVYIRPGVVFPDWSVVRSKKAETALGAILEVLGVERRWGAGYEESVDVVRRAVLKHYVHDGHAPSVAQLTAITNMEPERLQDVLRQLEGRDLIVLDESGGVIAGAYPFTERDTGHRIILGRRTLNAMCAIDALGVGAMVGRDIVIESSCRSCGAPIHIETQDDGTALKVCRPENAIVWSGIAYDDGCAATSLCTVMAFFCSNEHLESWGESNSSGVPGFRLSMDEAQQVGMAIFVPMLAPAALDN